MLVKKSRILNFVTDIATIEENGGLENLKTWQRKRSHVLTEKAGLQGSNLQRVCSPPEYQNAERPCVHRKGSFDQIFFVTLSNFNEPKAIFTTHLKKNGINPSRLYIEMLGKVTEGFNGAEIEQVVKGAVTEAFYSNHPMTEHDIAISAANIVPLSNTIREGIGRTERWVCNREIPASR